MPEYRSPSRRLRRALLVPSVACAAMLGGLVAAPASYADPEPTISEVRERVDTLYRQAEQATERYNAATDEMADVERRIERAAAAIAKQEAKVHQASAEMAVFAAAAYRAGGTDPTLRTFLAKDPQEFLAQATLVDAYANQQAEQVRAVAEVRRGLEQARLLADEDLNRQQAIEATLADEKATIEKLLDEAQEILDGLEAEERQRLARERELERQRVADQPSRGGSDDQELPDVPASGKGKIAVDFALAQLGEAYCWGGTGPSCWDCSGLTLKAWAQAGVGLPRSSSAQIGAGTRVSKSQLQPGDLVFYYQPISHVGMYIGGGKIVHATHPGDVVSIDSVDLMPFSGATRPG